jgi:hypothetical protein
MPFGIGVLLLYYLLSFSTAFPLRCSGFFWLPDIGLTGSGVARIAH